MRWKIKNPKQMMTRIAPVARAVFARTVFARTAWLGRHVVGEIRWQAPAWPHSVGLWIRAASSGLIAWIQRERKRAAWIAVISVVVIGGGAAGKRWYDHLPKPIEVSFEVTQPARTRIEDPNARPDPVVVTFNASVAPLAGVGKEVKSGIEMSPRVGGNWSWSDDRTLVFTPKADWPVDAEFAVELAKTGLVAEQIRLTQYKLKFRSAPFVATLAEVQFYQDPVDPASKKIVATVNFSHPVDTADFEKHVVLREAGKSGGFLGLGAENTKFRVSYDKLKLNAYVHSEALPIPAKPLRLDLAIEPGARAARGGKPTATALTHTVTVPGLYSLAVQSAVLTQAENQRLEPDRILMVNLSADTHEREVATKVRAWQLPVYHPESKEEDRKQPYRWDDSARIGPEILKQSEAVKLEPVAGEREYVEQHAFKVTAEAGRYLYIRVEKGVKSFGGYGVQPFSVNLARRKLKTIVKAPDLVKPGDTVKFRHSTDRPARIVVFAVDEGILQVARYRTADPLGYFFQKRALEVRTSQILDLILPEFKRFMAAAAPGGDAEGALGKHLNPFKRKRDKPVAYWSGIIDSGPQERELTWQVPDSFNGTLRIMAVAVSDDAIGVFEKKTLSRGDFVLSPNAPTTVTPGDEFDVSVGVANNVIGSGAEAQLTVALATSPHLEVIGEPSVKFKVGELREGVTSFRVRAKDELGSGNLIFTASLAKKSAKIATDMSVRPAQPYFVQLAAGTLHNGSTDVPVTRNLYSHYRKLEAGISYVPLALAHGLVSYLGNFSYSCTEQLVSMGMPALILSERPEFGYVKSKGHRSLARHFPERLGKLKPDTLEALVKPINNGYYNTYSSAQAILALDAYVRAAEKLPFSSLTVSEVLRDGTTRALTLPPTLMPRGSFTPNAAKLQFGNKPSSMPTGWSSSRALTAACLTKKPATGSKCCANM